MKNKQTISQREESQRFCDIFPNELVLRGQEFEEEVKAVFLVLNNPHLVSF